MSDGAMARVGALLRKDLAELLRTPGVVIPPIAIGLATLIPPLLITMVPRLMGESLTEEEEFLEGAEMATRIIPELAGLTGLALIESFIFHQFLVFLLLVPVVGSMAVAAHAVIGEKLARTLEPLLATPLRTNELLLAKTIAPFVMSMVVTWSTLLLFLAGVAVLAQPGVWQSLLGVRTALLFLGIGPLLALASLLLAVAVSSRVSDARTAQQFAALVILPITGVFVGQLMGLFVLGLGALVATTVGLAVVDAGLLWLGVRLFDRETILMRWK